MTLSARLTNAFLAALAVVLAGFSTALFVLASAYLHRQVDERLDAALNTLAAAAEVGPDGVEWEPQERSLAFGRHTGEGPFAWQVRRDDGQWLDGSEPRGQETVLDAVAAAGPRGRQTIQAAGGVRWRFMFRRLEPGADAGRPEDPAAPAGPAGSPRAGLILRAATALTGVEHILAALGLSLAALSIGIWALALVSGRWLCRRALRPLIAMADAAHLIGGDDLDQRLPLASTQDELADLGRAFNDLLARLQESFERQQRFTGDVSHQLRTPLTAILGHVDLALRLERDSDEYRRVLTLVRTKTHHLRQLVEALLFLARADAEALNPRLETVDLAEWIGAHARCWPETVRSADIRLDIDSNGPLTARVQPALLADLVNNLVDNASRYSSPGTPIRLSLQAGEATIDLTVADEGMGIAPSDLPHIFEPFYRSAEARRQGSSGLGLGLSIARRLTVSLGGTIEVVSQPNQGTRFLLRLPRIDPDPPAEPTPAPSEATLIGVSAAES